MRVFALGTGRNGSTTFARAASHATNVTAGHETRAHLVGPTRLAYPDDHVEADNRLSWLLGRLDEEHPDALYVHLTRDETASAESFAARWDHALPTVRHPRTLPRRVRGLWTGADMGMMRAYAFGIVMARSHPDRLAVARDLVTTVDANIRLFLKDKPTAMTVRLEDGAAGFAEVWERAGLEGDRDAALAEYGVRHNARAG